MSTCTGHMHIYDILSIALYARYSSDFVNMLVNRIIRPDMAENIGLDIEKILPDNGYILLDLLYVLYYSIYIILDLSRYSSDFLSLLVKEKYGPYSLSPYTKYP
jgi:hypothetical protein